MDQAVIDLVAERLDALVAKADEASAASPELPDLAEEYLPGAEPPGWQHIPREYVEAARELLGKDAPQRHVNFVAVALRETDAEYKASSQPSKSEG